MRLRGRISACAAGTGERCEVDGIHHRSITGIAWVQPVSRLTARQEPIRLARIAQDFVKVDGAIRYVTPANALVGLR